jgi:hypothetical protein
MGTGAGTSAGLDDVFGSDVVPAGAAALSPPRRKRTLITTTTTTTLATTTTASIPPPTLERARPRMLTSPDVFYSSVTRWGSRSRVA